MSVTAEFIQNMAGWRGDAKMYRLSEPVTVKTWLDETVTMTHIIVSASLISMSGPETYVFPSDGNSKEPTDWGELPGSFQGGLDHQEALDGFLDHVNTVKAES